MDLIPSISYSVTPSCNLQCEYCPEFGENYYPLANRQLPMDKLRNFLSVARSYGIETVRVTGGEPLLAWPRTLTVLKLLVRLSFPNIRFATNGVLLSKYLSRLQSVGVFVIKVSLDTLSAEAFETITGARHRVFARLMAGLDEASKCGLPIEINLVYTKAIADGVWGMIEYCSRNKFDLKVLDLVAYESQNAGYFDRTYKSPRYLVQQLTEKYGKPEIIRLSSGRGIPMFQFLAQRGIRIVVKDGDVGTTFSPFCESCSKFPCREGLFCAAISAEGLFRICKNRDSAVDLCTMDMNEIKAVIDTVLRVYSNSYYLQRIPLSEY